VILLIAIIGVVASVNKPRETALAPSPSFAPPPALAPPPTQQAPKTTLIQTQKSPPVNITTFASANEGELHRFYFLLERSDGRNVTADGHVQLQIFDDLNSSLYLKEFDVKEAEYVDYQFRLTGQSMGKAYEWRVPVSYIKKGISAFGWGRTVLTFTTPDGKELHAENTTIQIPTYTDKELEQMAEEEYAKSAKSILLIAEDDIFQVKLVKLGFFTSYLWGNAETSLRVDIVVMCKEASSFSSYDAKLTDSGGGQYQASFESKLEGGELTEGTTRTGYIIYKNVPNNVNISTIIIGDYVFDLKSNRGYTYSQLAEEEYEESSVVINKRISKGIFEITVTRAGFFSPYEWGSRKQYFRVDMEVRNIGSAADYYSPSGMVIMDNQGNQYEKSYGGSLDTFSQIYPNITKKGYMLFEGIPKTIGSAILAFQLGHDAQYNDYLFEYSIPLK